MKQILTILLFINLNFAYSQSFEEVLEGLSNGLNKLTEEQEKNDYTKLSKMLKDVYGDKYNSMKAVTDFKFYRNNGRFIYAYNAQANVVFMFSLGKREGKESIFVKRIIINENSQTTMPNAKKYSDWVKSLEISKLTDIDKLLYEQYLNSYIRYLMFHTDYINWVKTH